MTGQQNQNQHSTPPPEPPLTDQELRELREIMEADRRVKWLWATIRQVAIWIAAVGGALVLTWDGIVRAVRSIAGH